MTNERVVEQAAAGDADAFAQIVTKYQSVVFSICLRRTGDRAAAEDLTQDVFVTAHERLSCLRDPAKLAGWLRRVAVNTCNLWARERLKTLSLEEIHVEPQDYVLPLHAGQDAQVLVADALKRVSEKNHLVLTLHYGNGRSYQEIAELLNLPVATVKGRLREGRQQMKRELLQVLKKLLRTRLSPNELAQEVIARCHKKACNCARELLNP